MNEYFWDKKLNIKTAGIDNSSADKHHSPYEPTSYDVLFRLMDSGYINSDSVLIDYGCGKGRVSFFLSHFIGCRSVGIEYDEKIFEEALRNKKRCITKGDIEFICISAENYSVTHEDCFYFFNPFSLKLLKSVIARILASYYDNPRVIHLFFYYPTDEYLSFLLGKDELILVDEIDCRDLYDETDQSERILIFEIQ